MRLAGLGLRVRGGCAKVFDQFVMAEEKRDFVPAAGS